ncbi:MAG: hypothetical protein ACE5JI_04115 [Acidobacteriota bacterium]
MTYQLARAVLILALSGPLAVSGGLSLYHFLQVAEGTTSTPACCPEAVVESSDTWIGSSHALHFEPVHFCGVCIFTKSLRGAALASTMLAAPILYSTSDPARVRAAKTHSPGFFHVSRSPPFRT